LPKPAASTRPAMRGTAIRTAHRHGITRRDLERVAVGVRIAHLKQFSGHAPPESLEEYVELEELGQNHPLLRDVL